MLQNRGGDDPDGCWEVVEVVVILEVHGKTQPDQEGAHTEIKVGWIPDCASSKTWKQQVDNSVDVHEVCNNNYHGPNVDDFQLLRQWQATPTVDLSDDIRLQNLIKLLSLLFLLLFLLFLVLLQNRLRFYIQLSKNSSLERHEFGSIFLLGFLHLLVLLLNFLLSLSQQVLSKHTAQIQLLLITLAL